MKKYMARCIVLWVAGLFVSSFVTSAYSHRIQPPNSVFGQGDTTIWLRSGKKLLWTVNADSSEVAVFPALSLVVYNGQSGAELDTLYGRDFNGVVRWKRTLNDYIDSFGPVRFCAGGNILMVEGRGPLPHLATQYADVDHLNDVLDAYWTRAFRADSGRLLWNRSARAIGTPLWTDGKVFVTLRAVPHRTQHQNPPAATTWWLEKRQLSNSNVIWRSQVSGDVAGGLGKPSAQSFLKKETLVVRIALQEKHKTGKASSAKFLERTVPINSHDSVDASRVKISHTGGGEVNVEIVDLLKMR